MWPFAFQFATVWTTKMSYSWYMGLPSPDQENKAKQKHLVQGCQPWTKKWQPPTTGARRWRSETTQRQCGTYVAC